MKLIFFVVEWVIVVDYVEYIGGGIDGYLMGQFKQYFLLVGGQVVEDVQNVMLVGIGSLIDVGVQQQVVVDGVVFFYDGCVELCYEVVGCYEVFRVLGKEGMECIFVSLF